MVTNAINKVRMSLLTGVRVGREPLPGPIRKKVKERAKNRCQGRTKGKRCDFTISLDVHHINQKNSDNRLRNLELLCPNHHRLKHHTHYRKVTSKNELYGTKRTRLVKKTKKKQPRKKPYNPLDAFRF